MVGVGKYVGVSIGRAERCAWRDMLLACLAACAAGVALGMVVMAVGLTQR